MPVNSHCLALIAEDGDIIDLRSWSSEHREQMTMIRSFLMKGIKSRLSIWYVVVRRATGYDIFQVVRTTNPKRSQTLTTAANCRKFHQTSIRSVWWGMFEDHRGLGWNPPSHLKPRWTGPMSTKDKPRGKKLISCANFQGDYLLNTQRRQISFIELAFNSPTFNFSP